MVATRATVEVGGVTVTLTDPEIARTRGFAFPPRDARAMEVVCIDGCNVDHLSVTCRHGCRTWARAVLDVEAPPLTFDEALALSPDDMLYHRWLTNADGTPQRWRVNGRVRTWKRHPGRISVPLKRGLRQFYVLTERHIADGAFTLVAGP